MNEELKHKTTAREKSTLGSDTGVATVWTYLQTEWQSKDQTVFFLLWM